MNKQVSKTLIVLAAVLMMGPPPGGNRAAEAVAGEPSPAGRASTSGGMEALDWAFRFASAIEADPTDQSQAQHAVLHDMMELGELDEALERAERVTDWRRGAVYADLAERLARVGRDEEARALVARAEEFRGSVRGWQTVRIESHIGGALAALGEAERSREIGARLSEADARQYTGRAGATMALAHATRGEFTVAMGWLSRLDGHRDLEVAWWRTTGYLELARRPELGKESRLKAAAAARRSAGDIAGWKQAEALAAIGEAYAALDRSGKAREALRAADDLVASMPDDMAVKAPLLAGLARSWARIGEPGHARELLEQAVTSAVTPTTMVIEVPGVYAQLARTYLELGEHDRAWQTYHLALDAAAALENARPRALAVVAICRTIGTAGAELGEPVQKRLSSLLQGLKEPW